MNQHSVSLLSHARTRRGFGERLGPGPRTALVALWVGLAAWTAEGQPPAPEDVSGLVTVTTANEHSVLDRVERTITSTADVTIRNTGGEILSRPLHAVIDISVPGVEMPGALGGPGTEPYDRFYFDLSGQLNGPTLTPNESVTFGVTFVRPDTTQFTYRVRTFAFRGTPADTSPPVVRLAAPAEVEAATLLRVTAEVVDDTGVAKVSFFVDGFLVTELAAPPFLLEYNAPDTPGSTLAIRCVAEDLAGDEGEAEAPVAVVEGADKTPPSVSLRAPPQAAPGENVSALALALDNRGVAAVAFTHGGQTLGVDSIEPYEAAFAIPLDASPGSLFSLKATASDAAGNEASDETDISIVAAPDTEAPNPVTLIAPATALAGQAVTLTASAADNVGVLRVSFFREGVLLGSDPLAPYALDTAIPAGLQPGDQVHFRAKAFDFSGNSAESNEEITEIVAPTEGMLVGFVYDDTTGQPVAGAQVAIDESEVIRKSRRAVITDERGRFEALLTEGPGTYFVSKDGHTSGFRAYTLNGGTVERGFDSRLTPLAPTQAIDNLTGGSISIENGAIVLQVLPGAFGENVGVSLTRLSGQGLPGLLPRGWSPVSAFHVGPEGRSVFVPLQLMLSGEINLGGPSESVIAAGWDADLQQWVNLNVDESTQPGGAIVVLPRTGAVAVVKADAEPFVPTVPDPGQPLPETPAQPIPTGATLAILPNPDVLFSQPGAKSEVRAALQGTGLLPSGTPIQTDFNETYESTDGTQLHPEPMTQDFVLYQQAAGGQESRFVASPSEFFDPVLLKEGVIRLRAHRPQGAEGVAFIGGAGGQVSSPDGITLVIPPGAVESGGAAVVLAAIDPEEAGIDLPQGTFMAGASVDFGETELSVSALLSFVLPQPPSSDQILLVRAMRVENESRLELVGIGTAEGATVHVEAGGLGLPAPGITESGQYFLIQLGQPVGFVAGNVDGAAAPDPSVLVESDSLPIVSLTGADSPAYALPVLPGTAGVFARDLTNGNSANATADVTAGATAIVNLELGPARPTVVSVDPADGATGVPLTSAVIVKFSKPMDAASLTPTAFRIQKGGAGVAGTVSLLAGGLRAAFQPQAPFSDEVEHTVLVSNTVKDTFGQPLLGNQPDGSFESSFTTLDVTAPDVPPSGQITMSMPDDEGVVTIDGTQGTVLPGTIVSVFNLTTGAITTVIAGVDGSFQLQMPASISDTLQLVLRDEGGNQTVVPLGVFDNGNGTAGIGPNGGIMRLPDGSAFTFPEGSFAEPATVEIERFAEAESPIPTPTDFQMEFAAGFTIDPHGEEVLQPLDVVLPVDESYPANAQFVFCKVIEAAGEPLLVMLERGHFEDGAIRMGAPSVQKLRKGALTKSFVDNSDFPGILSFLGPTPFLVLFLNTQTLTFVTGTVEKAPPIGILTLDVPEKVLNDEPFQLVARATPIPPGVIVTEIEILEATSSGGDGNQLASGGTGLVERTLQTESEVNPSLISQVGSVVAFAFLGQRQQAWKARCTFQNADGKTFNAEVITAAEILPFGGDPGTKRRSGVRHVSDLSLRDQIKPVEGAFAELFNGLALSYPDVVQTNKLGNFILAAAPGPGFLRIFDPLTGQGSEFTFDVPSTKFDFVDFGVIHVPEGFGDGEPPTVDVQITGTLAPLDAMKIDVTATDNESVGSVVVFISGVEKLRHEGNLGSSVTETLEFAPRFVGDVPIRTIVTDISGNQTTRETVVTVTEPLDSGAQAQLSGDPNLLPGSDNIDLDIGIYLPLAAPVTNGVSLVAMPGVAVSFVDPATGVRIPAIGGTSCDGQFIRVRPATPLPPGTDLELDAGGTTVPFRTCGLINAGKVGGFGEIRGVASFGHYAYVADFKDDQQGVKIVDFSDIAKPKIVGGYFFPGGTRGIAEQDGILAAVGGGQVDLPVLRAYSLADPLKPERFGNLVLFPQETQAIPSNIRLKGQVGFAATIGPGLQAVDLGILAEIFKIPIAERTPDQRNGQAALVGGLRLPNPDFNPPLLGVAADAAVELDGLVVTGGSSPNLYILANTSGGVLSLIMQSGSGRPEVAVPFDVQRLTATRDFLVLKDVNGDGQLDFQNLNLVAVSHGNEGVSFVDVSRPNRAQVIASAAVGSPVFDMAFIQGFLYTGDRVISAYDPAQPIISGPLEFLQASGQPLVFTSGGDVDVASIVPLFNRKLLVTVLASSSDRKEMQVGQMLLPARGRDWDIIRTTKYEPYIYPDNEQFLHSGDPVNPFTGEFMSTETDLAIPGRGMDFMFTRTYRSQIEFNGIMGQSWEHNYNERLTVDDNNGKVIWYNGSGRGDIFVKGSTGFTAPRGVFAELRSGPQDANGFRTFELEFPDGSIHYFETTRQLPDVRFFMTRIKDRYTNEMLFKHNRQDQLVTVTDTMGRDIKFEYDGEGRLAAVTDFIDRTVFYRYDFDDNLIEVRSPLSQDFPDGKLTIYTYECGFQEVGLDGNPVPTHRLNHNLATITDPKGQTYLVNTYHPTLDENDVNFDKVKSQRLGIIPDGGEYQFAYLGSGSVVSQAITTNRSGHQTFRHYTSEGELEILDETADVNGSTTLVTTHFGYNGDGLLTEHTSPHGTITRHDYNPSSSRLRQGDLKQITVIPAGGGASRIYEFTHGPFGVPALIRDPSGRATQYTVDSKGNIRSIRYPSVLQADGTTQILHESYSYGAYGEVQSKMDTDGVVTTYEYFVAPVGPGYLRAVTVDSGGASGVLPSGSAIGRALTALPAKIKTSYTYDLVGNVKTVTDPEKVTTTYEVNPYNQATSADDGIFKREYFYDANDNVERVIELGNRQFKHTYDSLDRLIVTEESGSGVPARAHRYEYDESENLKRTTSPMGYTTDMEYDGRGLPTQVQTGGTGPLSVAGIARRMFYDEDGNLIREVNAEGEETKYFYNGFNELEKVEDPNQNSVVYEYDIRGFIEAERYFNANGQAVRELLVEHDEMGRVRHARETVFGGLSATGPTVPVLTDRSIVYDAGSHPARITDEAGRVEEREYDGLGRLTYAKDMAGNEVTNTYDGFFLMRREEVEGGTQSAKTVTAFTYDLSGRMETATVAPGTPDARRVEYEYDNLENVRVVTRQGGTKTVRGFDTYGRLRSETVGREVTGYEYDIDDRLTRIEDAQGRGIDLVLDGHDRIRTVTYADGSNETLDYYPDDMLREETDRAGNTFVHTYDPGNRLLHTSVTAAPGFAGVTDLAYAYDALNRQVSASFVGTADTHTTGFRWNSRSDLLEENQDGRLVRNSFGLSRERLSVSYPAGLKLTFGRDVLGRVDQLKRGDTVLADFEYAGPVRRAAADFGNGTRVARTFTAASEEFTRQYFAPNGAVQTGFEEGRDQAGRITGVARAHNAGRGDAFGYTPGEGWLDDALLNVADPLSSAPDSGTADHVLGFAYDVSGNRKTVTEDGASTSFSTNPLNQYSLAGAVTPQYDGNGNLTFDGRLNYSYDALNQLVRVQDAQTKLVLAAHEYDALGRRVRTVTPAGVEEYVFDGPSYVAVLDDQGKTKRTYVFGGDPDRPIMLLTNGTEFYYQFDERGSVAAITDAAGQVVERYAYNPFGTPTITDAAGNVLAASAIGNDLAFVARPWDPATGLVDMRARFYHPGLGRFLQTDPGGTIDGLNTYGYVGNDPINYTDPTGLFRQASADNIRTGHLGGVSILHAAEATMAAASIVQFAGALRGVQRVSALAAGISDLRMSGALSNLGRAGRYLSNSKRFGRNVPLDELAEMAGGKVRLPGLAKEVMRERMGLLSQKSRAVMHELLQNGQFSLGVKANNRTAFKLMSDISWATGREVGLYAVRREGLVIAGQGSKQVQKVVKTVEYVMTIGTENSVKGPRGTIHGLAHTHPSGGTGLSPADLTNMRNRFSNLYHEKHGKYPDRFKSFNSRQYIIDPQIWQSKPPSQVHAVLQVDIGVPHDILEHMNDAGMPLTFVLRESGAPTNVPNIIALGKKAVPIP